MKKACQYLSILSCSIGLKTTRYIALFMITTISLFGCKDYSYTLNEQPIFSPPPLFVDYSIPDGPLEACIKQAVFDQKVTTSNQLIQLNCSYAGISDLSGLEIFTELSQLNLDGNKLTEIKPLLFLSQLTLVSLKANPDMSCHDVSLLRAQVIGSLKAPSHCIKLT